MKFIDQISNICNYYGEPPEGKFPRGYRLAPYSASICWH